MDEHLRMVAQSGNIEALYAIIQYDTEILRRIEEMEFVDTPLHVAAAAGQAEFAMEMMNLKPSFARKLNQDGYSPIHMALLHNQAEIVIDLLSIDKDLVRVKGKKNYTPFHLAAEFGHVDILSQLLDICPTSVLDFTVRKETVLHIAAQNKRLEILRTILEWIQGYPENNHINKKKILNLQNRDGNTILHIAASNNQPQMVKLIMKCKEIDANKTNYNDLKALDVSQQQPQTDNMETINMETINILLKATYPCSRFDRVSINTKLMRDVREMKPGTINALLVVFALILAMSYQTLLSPPGGVFQGDASGNRTAYVGKSVLQLPNFVVFYGLNIAAFIIAWVITIALLRVVAGSIVTIVFILYLFISFSNGVALGILAPKSSADSITIATYSVILVLFFFIFYFIPCKKE